MIYQPKAPRHLLVIIAILCLFIGALIFMRTTQSAQAPANNTPPASNPQQTPPANTENLTKETTIFMVKMEDDGASANSIKVGCGDSVIPVPTNVSYQYDAKDPIASITAAMTALSATSESQYTAMGLDNPFAKSTITQKSPADKNGTIYTVHLNGTFSFAGSCEVPRVKAQIEETIKKAALGNAFVIDLNGGGKAAWDSAFSSK